MLRADRVLPAALEVREDFQKSSGTSIIFLQMYCRTTLDNYNRDVLSSYNNRIYSCKASESEFSLKSMSL